MGKRVAPGGYEIAQADNFCHTRRSHSHPGNGNHEFGNEIILR